MSWKNAFHMSAAMRAAEQAPGKPRKPTLKRYTWCRWHHELSYSPLWALVSQRAGVPQPIVEAFVLRLEVFASTNQPRGSLDGFNIAALAASWRMEEDALGRIYANLESPDVGWIGDDHVVSFWERNPDQEDLGAADRQRRKRDRAWGFRQLAAQERAGLISGEVRRVRELALVGSKEPASLLAEWGLARGKRHGMSQRDSVTLPDIGTGPPRAPDTAPGSGYLGGASGAFTAAVGPESSRRDSVIVTTRPDQTIKEEGLQKGNEAENSGEIVDIGRAELFLAADGLRIVVERMKIPLPLAETTIARWRREIGDDVVSLANIINAASATTLLSSKFHVLISEHIKRSKREAKGPQLPLAPVALRRSKHG